MISLAQGVRAGLGTLRGKILVAFVAMSLVAGSLVGFAVHSIGRAGSLASHIFDHSLISLSYARAAASDLSALRVLLYRRRMEEAVTADEALSGRIAELRAAFDSDLAIAVDRSGAARVIHAAARVRAAAARCTALDQPSQTTAPGWHDALDACEAQLDEELDVLTNLAAGQGFHDREDALAQIAAGQRLNAAGLAAGLAVLALVAWQLARQIIGPVAAASGAARRIAAGQLDTPIPAGAADELGALLHSMARMRDTISGRIAAEEAQRHSAQVRLVDAIESSDKGVILVDAVGQIVLANTQIGRFLPTVGHRLCAGEPFSREISAAMGGPEELSGSEQSATAWEMRLDDGRWLRISRSPTREGGFFVITSDITELKERERELLDSNLVLDAALDNMSQGLCLFDAGHRLRVANRRFCSIMGLTEAQVGSGTALEDVIATAMRTGTYAPVNGPLCFEAIRDAIAAAPQGLLMQDLNDGRVLALTYRLLQDGGFVATIEDVTARRQAESQVLFLVRHDALTRLPNRATLHERLGQGLAAAGRGEAFALLCLGLEHVKAIGDTLGHAAQDGLIRAVADRLSACARETDMVARLHGGEFAVMLTALERPQDASALARRVIDALSRPFEVDGQEVAIGVTVGIAIAPEDGGTADVLLKNAGIALSRAKAECPGRFRFFEPGMDEAMQARRTLELDLRRALAEEQFELFYQPLVDLKLGRLSGFEALMRWHHPRRGLVSPAEFIPVAEEMGLIVEMGRWTIRAACHQAVSWPAHVKVAVNVSPLQFKSPDLVATVALALAESGLAASRLELEITESVLLVDADATLATLHELRGLDVRISLDDFGTGYSSLSYLRSFPFDKIKIDQSFVRGGGDQVDCRAIVRAVVGLGRDLGIRITAEGVETLDHLDHLRREGCDELQGYLFSRPQPAPDLPGLLRRLERGAQDMAAAA